MSIWSKIVGLFSGGIVKEVGDAIDKNVTSDEERLKLRNDLKEIQAGMHAKEIELEEKYIELQKEKLKLEQENMKLQNEAYKANLEVDKANAASDSWFLKNYKAMIVTGTFLLICANYIGLLAIPVPEMLITVFGAQFGVVGVRKLFAWKGQKL